MRTSLFTAFALAAFAANSLLCRLALGGNAIDAASYTAVRMATGAAALLVLTLVLRRGQGLLSKGSWLSALALLLYAVPFSLAYRTIPAGAGALILFGSVQATMIGSALVAGERPDVLQWTGLVLALAGLGYLVRPGAAAPALGGSALMAAAGASWGIYSLRGRRSRDPLAETAANFLRAAPVAAAIGLAALGSAHAQPRGLVLASVSGALASGVGYAAWYRALPGLTATRAAGVQLAVPVLAAAGAVAWLGERVTPRLVLASAVILGGVALAVAGRRRMAA
ncbi:MAG: DMT family transporter [Thermoanaerobaculia bacterium]